MDDSMLMGKIQATANLFHELGHFRNSEFFALRNQPLETRTFYILHDNVSQVFLSSHIKDGDNIGVS